jgi:sugar transferase (PEP-CTERM/EpsH1 system associated)
MNLLFLAHRIPYPPNKGDKIRSWNELRYLAARHRVHLGCFADQPEDLAHVDSLRRSVASLEVVPLVPRRARLASLTALAAGQPLSVRYFASERLRAWVQRLAGAERLDAAFVFSSPMAAYVWDLDLPRVMDFCDVDSDKWRQYAGRAPLPMRPLYALEGRRLRAYEAKILERFDAATLVTERERELWRDLPEALRAKVHVVPNGVDLEYFEPGATPGDVRREPQSLVFTGAMDYYANVDAVVHFVEHVLPLVHEELPDVRFYIVGSRPAPEVQALARRPGVVVTGFVDDIRVWYARAALCVVPLRIARGIQNKVLEAMAMGRPVLASSPAWDGLRARRGEEIEVADAPAEVAAQVVALLRDPRRAEALGAAGRSFVEREYVWDRAMGRLDGLITAAARRGARPDGVGRGVARPLVPAGR